MASEGHQDDDPTPRGSPRLMGERLDHLTAYRKTLELRAGSPSPSDSHLFYRNLIIAIAVKAGLRHEVVARGMGISRVRVTNIVSDLESLLPPEADPA